ncbi:GGDEF domain-containing protein [Kurthia sibirica]|uniref:GGDEF domain-containing protein n=2 Tax=Kurthia sibirica TaxID=202750 RepID=A0A2U3ANW9_9BACL|nr:GGDEF domain-containing protein [Kurthia sibirica]
MYNEINNNQLKREVGDIIMRNKHILEDLKGQLLELWIVINNSNNKNGSEYYKQFEKLLFNHFQVASFHYYIVDHDTVFTIAQDDSKLTPYSFQLLELMPFIHQRHIHPNPLLGKFKALHPDINEIITIEDKQQQKIVGFLMFESTSAWDEFASTQYLDELINILFETVQLSKSRIIDTDDNKINAELLELTELFHSTMDIERILDAVILGTSKSFPTLEHNLILSNDQERKPNIKVHVFDYLNERKSTIEAFVSGDLVIENAEDLQRTILSAPIRGRQGTYGVIQLIASQRYLFTEKDKKLVTFLGNTSGNALENAKLYHQSHRLVGDLQLINESSHRLNMNLSQQEMLVYLSNLLNQSFLPSESAFVFFEDSGAELKIGTSAYFYKKEAQLYLDYVKNHFTKTSDPLFIADFQELIGGSSKYASMMVIPIVIREKVFGYALVVHENSYYFSFDSFKLMQSIIRHSSLAISNVILREQLQEMVDRDQLTKLYARHYLGSFVEQSVGKDDSGVFALIDIDNFKLVNDQFGHLEGDRVLENVAAVIVGGAGSNAISARWGGEELAVYFRNTPLAEAVAIADAIRQAIERLPSPSVTVSVGVSSWSKNNDANYKTIFKEADSAMYFAKRNGKNQVQIYDVKMVETET